MDLSSSQIAKLEKLLHAGFRLVTFERFERYLGVERDGFAALLEPAGGQLRLFSQAGYRQGEGIGMLVERGAGKAFIWHGQAVEATPELLAAYERFRNDLNNSLGEE